MKGKFAQKAQKIDMKTIPLTVSESRYLPLLIKIGHT